MRKLQLSSALFIVILASILTACGSQTRPKVEQVNLLVKCEDLPDVTGTTGAEVLSTLITWGGMYRECQLRHNSLVQAIDGEKVSDKLRP